VASQKRQRKREGQAARRAALEAARKRADQKRKLLLIGGLVAGVVVLALIVTTLAGRDKGSDLATTTTTAAPAPPLAAAPPVPAGRALTGDTPCPKADGSEERASKFEKAPSTCIDPNKTYTAVFTTSAGVVKAKLDPTRTPKTVNNFVVLARYHYYDGSSFQRTDPGIYIIQSGAPTTQSIGDPGPGYTIEDEGGKFTYTEGDLVMARMEAPNSSGAQYFFSAGPRTVSLDGQGTYVTFGKVTEGLDVLTQVLASHVACPPGQPECRGGAPQPPVTVTTITIEES